MVDVIIVSFAKDDKFKAMTEKAIKTALLDEVNVIVVEQNKAVRYDVMTLHYDFPFNYNKCLNFGLDSCHGEYVILCNNDLVFSENWATNLITVLEMGFDTVCPYCPNAHRNREKGDHLYEGFEMGVEFVGWCIAAKRDLIDEIGLNEEIEFWYSDNLLNEQLKRSGKKHALVCNSIVEHVGGGTVTLRSSDKKLIEKFTRGQQSIYKRELKKYAKRKGV